MRSWRLPVGVGVALAAVVAITAGSPAAGQAAPDSDVYVALGDSFTSGPLVLPHLPETGGPGRSGPVLLGGVLVALLGRAAAARGAEQPGAP